MTDKLLPCPFCGGSAKLNIGQHHFVDAAVSCEGCGADGPLFDADDGLEDDEKQRNRRDAIAAWNRRTPS